MNYIVYKTTNKVNGKIYVGVHYTNPAIDDGYRGCGVSKYDQKKEVKGFPQAIKKYGYENFIRETIEIFPDSEEGKSAAYKLEAEIVNEDFVKSNMTYNLTKGGKITIGDVNKKVISQYTIKGKFIRTWSSITEAEKSLGISNIYQVCIQHYKHSGGFQWRYYTDESDIDPVVPKEKSVYQFDLLGNLIKSWKSGAEASKQFNNPTAAKTAIHNVCKKITKQAYGYYWSYTNKFEYDPFKSGVAVAKYNDAGEFIESYTSITEAAKQNNIKTPANINAAIRGSQKRCGGFRWRYFDGNTSNIKPL